MLREKLIEFPQLPHHAFSHSLDPDASSILKAIDKFKPIIGPINAYFEHAQLYYNSSSCARVSQTQYPSLYRQPAYNGILTTTFCLLAKTILPRLRTFAWTKKPTT